MGRRDRARPDHLGAVTGLLLRSSEADEDWDRQDRNQSFGSREERVVLVRRDNIEHLVMVGGRNDFVIKSNIMRRAAC